MEKELEEIYNKFNMFCVLRNIEEYIKCGHKDVKTRGFDRDGCSFINCPWFKI